MKMGAGGSRRACPLCVSSCLVLPGGGQPDLLALAGGTAFAQQNVFQYRWNSKPPADEILPGDVRMALVWTGHLDAVYKGELDAAVRKAAQAWQKSKGHPPTDKLPDDQKVELVSEALKERDEVGWSVLRDSAVGVAVGFPAKLVTFGAPRTEGNILWYHGGGEVTQSLGVHLGRPSCAEPRGRLPAGHRQGDLSRPPGQLVRRLFQARRDPAATST